MRGCAYTTGHTMDEVRSLDYLDLVETWDYWMRFPPQHVLNGLRAEPAEKPSPNSLPPKPKKIKSREELDAHVAEVATFSSAVGAALESKLPDYIRDSLKRNREKHSA